MTEPFAAVRLRSLLLWMLVSIVVLFIAREALVDAIPSIDPILSLAIAGLLFYAGLAYWAHSEIRDANVPLRVLLRPRVGDMPAMRVGGLVAATLLLATANGLLVELLAPPMEAQLAADPNLALLEVSSLGIGLGVLIVVLVAPVIEEVIFRGLILRSWAYRYSLSRAIVGPAIVFGLLHPVGVPSAFVVALVLAVLYLKTRSLLLPIAVHALHNLAALLTVGVGPDVMTRETMMLVTLGGFAWSGVYLGAFLFRNWPR